MSEFAKLVEYYMKRLGAIVTAVVVGVVLLVGAFDLFYAFVKWILESILSGMVRVR